MGKGEKDSYEQVAVRMPVLHLNVMDSFIRLGEFDTYQEIAENAVREYIDNNRERIEESYRMRNKLDKLDF